jgi:hypothetical protein
MAKNLNIIYLRLCPAARYNAPDYRNDNYKSDEACDATSNDEISEAMWTNY